MMRLFSSLQTLPSVSCLSSLLISCMKIKFELVQFVVFAVLFAPGIVHSIVSEVASVTQSFQIAEIVVTYVVINVSNGQLDDRPIVVVV